MLTSTYLPARYRFLAHVGDVNPLDHSGGYLMRVRPNGGRDKSYTQIEYTDAPENEPEGGNDAHVFTVYRAPIPPDVAAECDWADIAAVAGHVGVYEQDWRKAAHGTILERAFCLKSIADYYGWPNLDSFPLELTGKELRKRWRNRLRSGAPHV